jgi:hypothetical protein
VSDKALRGRGKAFEEEFFSRQDEELRKRLGKLRDQQVTQQGLARVSGITDTELIDKLVALGIGPDTWTALSVVPLVEVAWANAQVEAKERRAVLAGAEANGIAAGSPSHELLQSWLEHRPDGRLLEAWGEYIVGLCASLAGGFLGLGSKISREEEVVLQELAKAFDR